MSVRSGGRKGDLSYGKRSPFIMSRVTLRRIKCHPFFCDGVYLMFCNVPKRIFFLRFP